MAPFYVRVCQELSESPDAALLDSLKNANRQDLARLDEAVRDAEENLGDVEQREALLARAEYLSGIGDKVRVSQALWLWLGGGGRQQHCCLSLSAGRVRRSFLPCL